MATIIQQRSGTAAEWTTADPVLAEGEMGVELDTLKFKIGDGVTAWTGLEYSSGARGLQGIQGPMGPASPVTYQPEPPANPDAGMVWVDSDSTLSDGHTLGGLEDVDLTGAVNGQTIILEDGTWVPGASSGGGGGGGATGGGTDQVFHENDQVVTADYTITAGKNAVTAGPVTINPGITVTVPSGSTWVVV